MATIEKDVLITDCSDLEVESASADSDDPSTNNNNEILGWCKWETCEKGKVHVCRLLSLSL